MIQIRSIPFPLIRSPSSSDSSPYNSPPHSASRSSSSLFLSFDSSDSEYDDYSPASSLVSLGDSDYISAMGKDSPNKLSKRKRSKTDLRFPLAPINSATDFTQESPKRPSTFRTFMRKKKKSTTNPLPADLDPFTLAFPLPPPRDDVEPIPQPIFLSSSPQSNLRDGSGQVFQPKNCFVLRRGMRHHPYPRDDAPYMQSYDPTLLDNDRYSEILLKRLNTNHSPSFLDVFTHTTPKTILDLGCGAGGWAIEAAEFWPSSQVIGFDLLDPVLLRGCVESPSNVQWKQGNFVKYKLPFPKNMFDLVRIANLSLCVPYERWEHLLSEARRVLARGGRLELIDDYLYFPYTKHTPHPSGGSHDLPRSQPSTSLDFDFDDELDADEPPRRTSIESDNDDADEFMSTRSRFSTLDDDGLPFPPLYDPILDWDRNVDNSKSMETLFEEMLSKKFSIHPRPSKFIDSVIDKVFGRYNQSKLHEFNLYLAPPSAKDSDESSLGSSEAHGGAGLKKAGKDFAKWMTTVEWDPKDKEKKPRKSSDRSNGESSIDLSMVPSTISAKAAGRLGIAPIAPSVSPPSSKAHAAQSPGLILWPSTFIPIPPLELEMHACKHLHTLIGCKAALMEFVAEIAEQRRLPFDEQFVDDRIWDYESFRRKRFNWPSECSDLETPNTTTPRSMHFRHSSDGHTPTQERPSVGSFGAMNAPPDPLFPRDKLDFVRSIRVYSATKVDEEIHVS